MKKILFCIIGCFVVLPLGADNVTTTKPYVDYHVGQKQDKIPGIPSGYIPVEYIESTGTQYINTQYSLVSNNVIYEWSALDQSTSSSTSLFGAQGTQDGGTRYSGILYGSNTTRRLYAGSTTSMAIGYASNDSAFHDWKLDMSSGSATLVKDGSVLQTKPFSGNLYKGRSITLFGNNTTQYSNLKLRYYRIIDNGKMAFNGIPVKYNNVCGLYDTVSRTFKPSASGSLICGPEGVGAIVTYGATDGSIGSAVIANQIGTSTAESTIPMTGTLVKELTDKMDTVGAGAGFVMAGEIVDGGTSTAHAKKPVYMGEKRNNYNDALVPVGVVNDSATDAANNELSCLDNDCTLWRIGSDIQIFTTCKSASIPCINSDECCSNSCVLGQCFATCVPSGGNCSQNSDCCKGLSCLFDNKCGTPVSLSCKSDSNCSGLTPYCCNGECQATECADTVCAKQGELCGSTPCCEGLSCSATRPSVCILKKS